MRYLFVILICAIPARAVTYTAASCSQSAVQAAINSELATPADGDIISIPSGTCAWTGTTEVSATFSTSVTIQGAGAISSTAGGASTTGSDVTIIQENINHVTGPSEAMNFTTTAGKSFRLTGIAILGTASSSTASAAMVEIQGGSTSIRVDHLHFFTQINSSFLRFDGPVYGVVDHIFMDAATGVATGILFHNGSGFLGDGSWADTDHFGTSQFMFVEDSRYNNEGMGDAHDGARYVLRHNTLLSSDGSGPFMANHGLDGGDFARSMRAAEVYQNTLTDTFSVGAGDPTYANNGGTLLYWGNTVSGYRSAISIDYTRKDNGTYDYGTTPGNWGFCSTNTSSAWDQKATPPSGYACMDQPARGGGDLLTGTAFPNIVNSRTGTIAWPQQALSPIYVWNNTFTPSSGFSPTPLVESDSICATCATFLLLDNRDYYQQFGTNAEPGSFDGTRGVGQGLLSARPSTCTAGPGGNTPGVGYWATDQTILYVCNPTNVWTTYYTPFIYPHPLASGAPLPPTGLTAVAN